MTAAGKHAFSMDAAQAKPEKRTLPPDEQAGASSDMGWKLGKSIERPDFRPAIFPSTKKHDTVDGIEHWLARPPSFPPVNRRPVAMRIVLCYPVEPRHLDRIASVAPHADLVDAGQERIGSEILSADVFIGHAKVPVPWDDVVRHARLRWIQSSAAGLDHCLTPAVIESDIAVTSASGLFADQVAEQTLALLLGLLRGLPVFFRAAQRKEFIRRPTRDLHHATVGIVGFGGNGRRLAQVLAPFKLRILATDVFPVDKPEYVEQLWPADRLDDLLPLVDVLILCVPLNNTTRGLIDRRSLARMKPGALLINVARGPNVVEADLIAALESGHLGGAGLDVTEVEPLPATSRLWELPNVIITPHVGAQADRRVDDTTDLACENLRRYLAGEPLLNLVDKRLGFPIRGGTPGVQTDRPHGSRET